MALRLGMLMDGKEGKTGRKDIWAVDFDGTLYGCSEDDPTPRWNRPLVDFLCERQAAGEYVILWTCRTGEALDKAIEKTYAETDLRYDAVNENLDFIIDKWRKKGLEPPRKVYANHYIDDKVYDEIPVLGVGVRFGWEFLDRKDKEEGAGSR